MVFSVFRVDESGKKRLRPTVNYACPACCGSLTEETASLLCCTECERQFPTFAQIPVLLTDSVSWVGSYRESILATLAVHECLSAMDVATVEAIADISGVSSLMSFACDWDRIEADDTEQYQRLEERFQKSSLGAVIKANEANTLYSYAARWLSALSGDILEIGCGVGRFTSVIGSLSDKPTRLHVMDNNLKALMRCQEHMNADGFVIGDAEALPYPDHSFDALVAMNLIDLLDAPDVFLDEASRVLRPAGLLILSTPEPALGIDDDDIGRTLRFISEAGFENIETHDGLIWPRVISPRQIQLYEAQLTSATMPKLD